MAFNYNKKREKQHGTILDGEKYMFREDFEEEQNQEIPDNRVDYLRRVMAISGRPALICSVLGLICALFCFSMMTKPQTAGEQSMLEAALVMSSIMWSLASVFFAIRALLEDNKNYNEAFLGMAVSSVQIITWVITLIIGSK